VASRDNGEFTPNSSNWIGDPNLPLKGFSWKKGVQPDTTGILMWNDVFLHDSQGEKIAIVLMDTQGLFDTNTPAEINARIFSMSVLISSVQIFNIHQQIAENHLEYLKV
jgi:atlastin